MSKYPEGKFNRHPLNVPGPFYVEEGQCIICLAPREKAPEMIGFFAEPTGLRGYSHCYVKRQPVTPEETGQMVRAIEASCCAGLRYCGDDPAILATLAEAGFGSRCDELWDEDAAPAQAGHLQSAADEPAP